MPYRLYLVKRDTDKCTGKKRDYSSEAHFKKYGIDTYHSYNREFYCGKQETGLKARLCFLNAENKWEKVDQETLNKLLEKNE